MGELAIRAAQSSDLADFYRVALLTGDSGSDATGMHINDEMLGEVFVGPYVNLSLSSCFALVSGLDVIGYGLCVPDTKSFEVASAKIWWPQLQDKYEELKTQMESSWLLKEIFYPEPSPTELLNEYPAHGHIDLLPEAQGKGWGRKMMQQMEYKLSEVGASGFHLRVSPYNHRALDFYQALGYRILLEKPNEIVVGKKLK